MESISEWGLRAQRVLLFAAVIGAVLLVWPSETAAYGLPKATLIALTALSASLIGIARALVLRRVEVQMWPVAIAMSAVVALMAVATIASPTPLLALMGSTRQTGLVAYVAYLALALVGLRALRDEGVTHLLRCFLVAGGISAFYALLQIFGTQPLPFTILTTPVFSTLGNANFVSGWLAIVAPLALWAALPPGPPTAQTDPKSDVKWRVAGAALYLLCVIVIIGSRSIQGLPALLAGTALVLGVWVGQSQRWSRGRRWATGRFSLPKRVAGVLFVVAVLGGLSAVALRGVGPQIANGLSPRLDYWSAALRLTSDNPMLGTGPDTFEQYYPSYYEQVSDFPYESTDNPHNVPLTMFSSGGIVLGVAYLGLVAVTGATLAAGLRRQTGQRQMVLAAAGSAWVAYQVQSFVSIDIPPLALAHWVLAAAIVVAAGLVPFRSFAFGWAAAVPQAGRPRSRRGVRAPLANTWRVALAILVAVGLATAVMLLRPMRAVAAADRAAALEAAGDSTAALEAASRATELAPWQARNWYLKGRALERVGQVPEARQAAERAAELAPGSGLYQLIAAEFAQRAQDHEAALRLFRRAYAADPRDGEVVLRTVRALLIYAERDEALTILTKALARGESADLLVLKGRLLALDGRTDLAIQAYEDALTLDPTQVEASAYLRR